MAEEDDKSASNHLTAEELIKTRGISGKAYDDFTRSSSALPKIGEKLLEPNGSWLQDKQISTNLEKRRDLLKIERVNRLSLLAAAEWLPEEKRALVIKKTGVEWNNYGTTLMGNLYLLPEEALLLLELNLLELIWKGMPLSIQQAYELLIDSPEGVSLSEYRVYSQLARSGYRLQRYKYEKSTLEKLEEASQPKKKVVVVPENGQWIENDSEEDKSKESMAKNDVKSEESDNKSEINGQKSEDDDKSDNKKCAQKAPNPEIDMKLQDQHQRSGENGHKSENDRKIEKDDEKSGIDGKFETTDEKPIELGQKLEIEVEVHEKPATCVKEAKIDAKSKIVVKADKIVENSNRIDQNSVKDLETAPKVNGNSMPKTSGDQTSKTKSSKVEIVSDETIIEPIKIIRPPVVPKESPPPKWTAARIQRNVKQLPKRIDNKRKSLQGQPSPSPPEKKFREEVIDLSDDEIQEIPRTPTRMETLNLLPNIASNERIAVTRERLPPNVCPQRQFYQCDRRHLEVLHGNDENARSSGKGTVVPYVGNSAAYRGNSHFYQNPGPCRGLLGHHQRFSPYQPRGFLHHRPMIPLMQPYNLMNHWSAHDPNVIRNSFNIGCSIATAAFQQSVNVAGHMMWQMQSFFRGRRPEPWRPPRPTCQRIEPPQEFYQSSFTVMPSTSWSELKQKWKEAKTITIDDEDDAMDCSGPEVVEGDFQPLVGPKHVGSVAEVFQRLKIIKRAQERTVRRKKGNYSITYKVYPRDHSYNYRKSNPGPPLFNVIVTSNKQPFLQPVELNRLQQDGNCTSVVFALVTASSISYLQTGIVSLPNLSTDYESH